jgi:hypothetical protein
MGSLWPVAGGPTAGRFSAQGKDDRIPYRGSSLQIPLLFSTIIGPGWQVKICSANSKTENFVTSGLQFQYCICGNTSKLVGDIVQYTQQPRNRLETLLSTPPNTTAPECTYPVLSGSPAKPCKKPSENLLNTFVNVTARFPQLSKFNVEVNLL